MTNHAHGSSLLQARNSHLHRHSKKQHTHQHLHDRDDAAHDDALSHTRSDSDAHLDLRQNPPSPEPVVTVVQTVSVVAFIDGDGQTVDLQTLQTPAAATQLASVQSEPGAVESATVAITAGTAALSSAVDAIPLPTVSMSLPGIDTPSTTQSGDKSLSAESQVPTPLTSAPSTGSSGFPSLNAFNSSSCACSNPPFTPLSLGVPSGPIDRMPEET